MLKWQIWHFYNPPILSSRKIWGTEKSWISTLWNTYFETQYCENARIFLPLVFTWNTFRGSEWQKKFLNGPHCVNSWKKNQTFVWKNEKFPLTNFFRQINSLVKPSLWRDFCQKCSKENSRNFHTVKFRIFLSFRFYVKSILEHLKLKKIVFL